MELRILFFWVAAYGCIWLLRRNPKSLFSRAAFSWIGPYPNAGETWARFQLRWACYSFEWLCQFAISFAAVFAIASYFPTAAEETWFGVCIFALPLGIGIATLAMLGFLVKSGKAKWLGPNPMFPEVSGTENMEIETD